MQWAPVFPLCISCPTALGPTNCGLRVLAAELGVVYMVTRILSRVIIRVRSLGGKHVVNGDPLLNIDR